MLDRIELEIEKALVRVMANVELRCATANRKIGQRVRRACEQRARVLIQRREQKQ